MGNKMREPVIITFDVPSDIELCDTATGADFGATKERLVYFGLGTDGNLYPVLRAHWMTEDNLPLAEMIEAYNSAIRQIGHNPPEKAGFAVAGPIHNGSCDLTNSDKAVSEEQLRYLGIDALLINDFFANVAAAPLLRQEHIVTLEHTAAAEGQYSSNKVVALGPGGGTGVGFGEWMGEVFRPRPSEGGHTVYTPTGRLEDSLVRYIREKVNAGRPVECEQIASGTGVSYIFSFLANGKLPSPKREPRVDQVRELRYNKNFTDLMHKVEKMRPPQAGREIIQAFRDGFDGLRPGIDIFVDGIAIAAINQVQAETAYGGTVYIFGGHARRTLSVIEDRFMRTFDNPYLFADKFRGTDVAVVPARNIGAMGAASLRLKPELYS
ncbi:MAG: glucokinase [archaeon]